MFVMAGAYSLLSERVNYYQTPMILPPMSLVVAVTATMQCARSSSMLDFEAYWRRHLQHLRTVSKHQL